MIWKPGDRAVFCYRPSAPGGPKYAWPLYAKYIGRQGIVTSYSFQDSQNETRVNFKILPDISWAVCVQHLAPILEDPFAAIPKGEHVHV